MSNARRLYSSKGDAFGVQGLKMAILREIKNSDFKRQEFLKLRSRKS